MDTYIIHPAPHKKQHRHRTAALLSRHPALCVQIAVAAHSGAETGPTDSWSTNFKRSVKHSLRRAESRLSLFFFFSQHHNIQRRDGGRLVMLSEQVDVSSVGSPWSTINRVQDAEQRGRERYWQSAAEHEPFVVFPFFNSWLLYSTSLSRRPDMLHVEKAASKDVMKSSFYFMILERNWGCTTSLGIYH